VLCWAACVLLSALLGRFPLLWRFFIALIVCFVWVLLFVLLGYFCFWSGCCFAWEFLALFRCLFVTLCLLW
jgi:hypothetical protein